MIYGNDVVCTGLAVILWDGITRPDQKEDKKTGTTSPQWSLKVALLNNAPEVNELSQIATKALQADPQFRGNMPNGGHWPINNISPTDFEGKLPSHVSINAKSNKQPQVFDSAGRELPPTAYNTMLYPGAVVQVLVHAFSFNNVQKGIGFGLDGIRIVDATAPRLPVGGVDAAAAFAAIPPPAGTQAPAPGYAPPPVAPQQPQYAAPPAPINPAPVAPGQIAPPQPGYAAPPAPGYAPPPVAPAPEYIAPPAPAHQMTAAAGGATYEQMIANGWTDATLVQHGMMLA